MAPDDDPPEDPPDDPPEDKPEELPEQQSAADPREHRKRQRKATVQKREDAEFLRRILQEPAGRRFIWGILQASGAFEERYGFGPYGAYNPDATAEYRGQKDFGLRLYHSWAVLDRAGILSVLDEHHPQFPKKPKSA